MEKVPMIVAHRGARDEAPENTAAAFDRALAYSVDGIELDVQMTRDSVPVIYHDRTLYRICRKRLPVSNFNMDELLSMDFGEWFSPDFKGEPILTLKEAMSRYSGSTRLLIEIKSRPRDQAEGRHLVLTEKVIREVCNTAFADSRKNIYILSFDMQVLQAAFSMDPELRLVRNMPDRHRNLEFAVSEIEKKPAAVENLTGLCFKVNLLSPKLVALAKSLEKQVMTYTCNGVGQISKALHAGVDVLMTDRPNSVTSYFHKMKH